jgi:uncharacterized membrane protein YfcA
VAQGFLGVPDVDLWLFVGLTAASFFTHFFGMVTGAAGGLLLLATLASFFPPVVVVPMHTIIQLATNIGRVMIMWRLVLRHLLAPFLIGSAIGAFAGAQIFVSLPSGVLQGIIACFILISMWLPRFAQLGQAKGRFAVVGFAATFLGVFVSATGTMVGPFVHHASPDRRNYVATFGALMVIMHSTKLLAFISVGIALHAYAPLIVALIASGIFATWVGRQVLDRVPEKIFRVVFRVILTLLAIRLLFVAGRQMGLF